MGIRAFLAIPASPEVITRTRPIFDRLAVVDQQCVKWVDPDQLHLTVQFFGDIRYEATSEICRLVASVTRQHAPFLAEVRGLGAFPNVRRPRTIWAGFAEGRQPLIELAHDIQRALKTVGYPVEHRQFQPHLTLGRVKGREPLRELALEIEKGTDEFLGSMPVEETILFRSELSSSGPTYHRMGTMSLSD